MSATYLHEIAVERSDKCERHGHLKCVHEKRSQKSGCDLLIVN